MINDNKVKYIIEDRKNMRPDDPRIMDKWKELTDIFVESEEDTIAYLNNCGEDTIEWIREVFEDISEIL